MEIIMTQTKKLISEAILKLIQTLPLQDLELLQIKLYDQIQYKRNGYGVSLSQSDTSTKKFVPKAGSAKHLNIVMSDDFDEPLEDFAEYM